MPFNRELFGYARDEVDQELSRLSSAQEHLQRDFTHLQGRLRAVEADRETQRLVLAELRRTAYRLSQHGDIPQEPVLIMVGPVHSFRAILDFSETVETLSFLAIRFRLFRDGYFRLDGHVTHLGSLLEWLRERPEVHSVTEDQGMLLVSISEGE